MNLGVGDSIKAELEKLESVGRVSARGRREVHAAFGFSEMTRAAKSDEPAREPSVAQSLDDAFSRLKSRVAPE